MPVTELAAAEAAITIQCVEDPLMRIPIRIRQVILKVCHDLADVGVLPHEILNELRSKKYIAHARQRCYYEIRQLKKPDGSFAFSFPQIARWLNRDHSSVQKGISAYKKRAGLK